MPDKVTSEVRSAIMRSVKSKNSKSTERRLRAGLAARGIRGWSLDGKGLPGTPDIVFSDRRVAIFIDGCFWHGCPVCYRPPKSNTEYWEMKVRNNVRRDHRVDRQLRSKGWSVLRIHEHELKEGTGRAANRILRKTVQAKSQSSRDRTP